MCRSGTEEDFGELQQLLEDISTYMKDFEALKAAQAAQKVVAQKKVEDDKQRGEEMRKAAMLRPASESIWLHSCHIDIMQNVIFYLFVLQKDDTLVKVAQAIQYHQ